uniref:Uncharacterized protein n=1 Tax=Panagrolaimus superbus TaxID=310955 RepID=A0A914YBL7_9BILA
MSNDKPPPSYEDVFKSLISFKSKIPDASPQHKVLIEFIETFEDFIKKQHSSTFGTALGYGKKLFSWLH